MTNKIKESKFLITGGAGFIGSHMTDRLIELGADVFIIDNFETGRRENLNPSARLYEMDINSQEIQSIFAKEKPDYVYHLAFNTRVPKAVEDPLFDAKSITDSLNIIINSKKHSVKKIIFPSSGFVYGNNSPKPTKENQSIEPISPYVVSKNAVENYLYFFNRAYGLPYVIFRYAAIYGPRQLVTGAMQDYIKKLSHGEQAEMYGDPTKKTRDFVFIEDAIKANLLALEIPSGHPSPIFNIGTGIETSLLELYQKIAALLGNQPNPIMKPEKPGEQTRYSLDSSKIKNEFGWEPTVSLDKGLRKTLKSYNLI